MIGSVRDQNKQLSDAGQKPIDTSPRRLKSDSFSARVASSGSKNEAESRVQSDNLGKANVKKIKASYEGLMHSPSTLIQLNGSGYDRKSIQSARYSKNLSPFVDKKNDNSFSSSKNYSIMNNYSKATIKNSSSFRMNNVVKTNMSFK